MRKCVIDVGTNSTRFIIGESDSLWLCQFGNEITRLGEDVSRTGEIKPQAMARTIKVIRRYVSIAQRHKAEKTVIIATSVCRDARNTEEFRNEVWRETGLEVRILTGEEEAFLTYRGVKRTLNLPPGRVLVIDIGGGSTELCLGEGEKLLRQGSFDVGCVRLTERYFRRDPPGRWAKARAARASRSVLAGFFRGLSTVETVVGVGGTVTTLACLGLELDRYWPAHVHNSTLTLAEIKKLSVELCAVDLEERRRVLAVDPDRADIIIAGTIILQQALRLACAEKMKVSNCGLLYGELSMAPSEAGDQNEGGSDVKAADEQTGDGQSP